MKEFKFGSIWIKRRQLINLLGETKFFQSPSVEELQKILEETIRIQNEMSKYLVTDSNDPWKKALDSFKSQRYKYKKGLMQVETTS